MVTPQYVERSQAGCMWFSKEVEFDSVVVNPADYLTILHHHHCLLPAQRLVVCLLSSSAYIIRVYLAGTFATFWEWTKASLEQGNAPYCSTEIKVICATLRYTQTKIGWDKDLRQI